jgi:hypothetical protein
VGGLELLGLTRMTPQLPSAPQQQFLDDPKYSNDEDLPSKLEAFKGERGWGWGGLGVGLGARDGARGWG